MQRNFTKTKVKFENHNFFLEDVMNWDYDSQHMSYVASTKAIKADEIKHKKNPCLIISIANGMTSRSLFVFGPKSLEKKFDKIMADYTKLQIANPKNKYLLG